MNVSNFLKPYQDERFYRVFEEKAQPYQEKMNQIYNAIVNSKNGRFTYEIDNMDHNISIKYYRDRNDEDKFNISENIRYREREAQNRSILHQLFGDKVIDTRMGPLVTYDLYPAVGSTEAKELLNYLIHRADFSYSKIDRS